MSKEKCLAPSTELNRYVSTKFISYLTSRLGMAPRIYAFAALARCNRLLTGMIAMHEAGYDDLAGMNARPIVECWFKGTYLLLAPDEALSVLNLLHKEQLEKMEKGGWKDLADTIKFVADLGLEESALSWWKIAVRIDELLANTDESDLVTAKLIYNSLYRGKSQSDIHAGIGTLQGHIELRGEVTYTLEIRPGDAYEMDQTKPAASLVGLLALMTASRIGFSDPELLRLHKQVISCGDPRSSGDPDTLDS